MVYPFGCTLKLRSPALPIITSGPLAFPANRALSAVSRIGSKGGLLAVLGSFHVFDDDYLLKGDNQHFLTALIKLLSTTTEKSFPLEDVKPDRSEYGAVASVPDVESLADRLKSCLQETEELPVDFTTLFDHNLFKFDTNMVPAAIELYKKMNVKHETLTLIPPQFEVPLPPLQPAVFMPVMRELPAPPLELYDLDEHFSNEKIRLAQLTNKCSDNDLDYFIKEAGEVVGIAEAVRQQGDDKDAENLNAEVYSVNKVLAYVLKKLIQYKKIEQDNNNTSGSSSSSISGGGNDPDDKRNSSKGMSTVKESEELDLD